MTSVPYGATLIDTGEFLLGDVAVTPVFFESNGQQDTSSEDWDGFEIQETLEKIDESLDWWVDLLATQTDVHEVSFTVDDSFATTPFETRYEPISRRSNDYALYVREFLDSQGFSTGSIENDMKSFNHAQRLAHNTNWAFTIVVAPSFEDEDGMFASGGSFRQAFAFASGLFMVVPSTRPASTFAHELGHLFWARDEYPGGGSYFQYRGYYNTQNLNAHDNPEPDFVQEPSIMASNQLLQEAWENYVSPESTLAMIGWQDSDDDGIFDVLDVPHSLTGTGYLDVDNAQYHFVGHAAVQTLANLNPSGLQNDITLNRIREIEYRFDDGAWEVHSLPDAYEVDLDLTINVPSGAQKISIRARDSETTVESNIFEGDLDRVATAPSPGINGAVWIDANKNSLRDVGEYGPEFFTVELVDGGGAPITLRTEIEPDDFASGQLQSGFSTALTLTATGTNADGRIGVFTDATSSTGSKTFRGFARSTQSYSSNWNSALRLQADFSQPTTMVLIDAIGTSNPSFGRLEAFNSAGEMIDRYTTSELNVGQVETMEVHGSDIAYIIASGHASTAVKLDFLRFGAVSTTVTGSMGEYAFPYLPAGTYNVKVTPSSGHMALDPASGQAMVTISDEQVLAGVDFGFQTTNSPWQNPANQYDVFPDDVVSALDALIIINDINENSARELGDSDEAAPPYIDVSGDNFISALDVLMVINHINSNSTAGGEGEGIVSFSSGQQLQPGNFLFGYGPFESNSFGSLFAEGEFSELEPGSEITSSKDADAGQADERVAIPIDILTPKNISAETQIAEEYRDLLQPDYEDWLTLLATDLLRR